MSHLQTHKWKRYITQTLLILCLISVSFFISACSKDESPDKDVDSETESEATTEATSEDTEPETDETVLLPAPYMVDGAVKYGYIDLNGNKVIEPIYDFATEFSEGFAVVSLYTDVEIKNQVIDPKGNIIFENGDSISPFINGYAAYMDTSTYQKGFIDTTGNIVIPPAYAVVSDFNSDGHAYAIDDSGALIKLDAQGKVLNSLDLGEIGTSIYDIKEGFATFSTYTDEGNFMGVIDMKGNTIIEAIPSNIVNLGTGRFAVSDPSYPYYEYQNAPSAIYNEKGEALTDYLYYDLGTYRNGYVSAVDDRYTYFLDLDGNKLPGTLAQEGRGYMSYMPWGISAMIDDTVSYHRPDGELIWIQDKTIQLTESITVSEEKFRPTRMALIKYPSFKGLESADAERIINDTIKDAFVNTRDQEYLQNLSVDDDYSVDLRGDLLSVLKTGYDYPLGAAHGMPIMELYFADIKTGQFFTLADFFDENKPYLEELSVIVGEEIQKRSADASSMLFPETYMGITEDTKFYIKGDTLVIYFYPYDIAAYAAGFQEFEISFDDIMPLIDTEGDFWKAFH